MTNDQLAAQALGFKETAETMIKAGSHGGPDAGTQVAIRALITEARRLYPNNAVVAVLSMGAGPAWPEVLAIANSIYKAS